MMKKREYFVIPYLLPVFLVLMIVIAWAVIGIFQEEKEPELIKVAVIVEDSNNARWDPFLLGLETAAKEAHVDLNLVPTSSFENAQEEWNLADQKVDEGAQGIILSPYDAEGYDDYYEPLSWKVSLCIVNSGLEKMQERGNILTAIPDYEQMAEGLLNQIKADYGDSLAAKTFYIMTCHGNEQSSSTLMELVEEGLIAEGCLPAGQAKSRAGQRRLLKKNGQPDIMVALDDDSLRYAAGVLANGERHSELYGIGTSESAIYYLDQGIIKGMIVPDDFNMGYESLLAVAQHVRNKFREAKELKLSSRSVRREDVHNPEMEQFLFPKIQ